MPDPNAPYAQTLAALQLNLDATVDAVFNELTSQFMLLPKGSNFLEYPDFLGGYEALRLATSGFIELTVATCWSALRVDARAWIVLRTIMGLSPPEWGDLANELGGTRIPTNWCRGVDSEAKADSNFFNTTRGNSTSRIDRVTACLNAAVGAIVVGAAEVPEDVFHRLNKFDTADGLTSVEYSSVQHVPYAVLLYERFLGRPFASHRDAVSELVGDVMESSIEAALTDARIPHRKTGRAERVVGFEQAPDFFAPDELAPTVIIEAKVCGDDGTARDKVSRVLRLASMRDARIREGRPAFQVVACIDGRGFSVRRQDMKDLLEATQGKVFTLNSIPDLIRYTDLRLLAP